MGLEKLFGAGLFCCCTVMSSGEEWSMMGLDREKLQKNCGIHVLRIDQQRSGMLI
jgi:hypothetical protein